MRAPSSNHSVKVADFDGDPGLLRRARHVRFGSKADVAECETDVWIEKKALEIGLEGNQFVSALAYAGNEGWLADAARRDWTSLTRAGQAITRR